MRRMHMRGRVRAVWPFVLPLAQVGRALPLPLPACMAGSIASRLDRRWYSSSRRRASLSCWRWISAERAASSSACRAALAAAPASRLQRGSDRTNLGHIRRCRALAGSVCVVRSLLSYRSLLDAHVLPRWGTLEVRRLEHGHIAAWTAEIATAASSSTTRKAVGVLRPILELAVRDRRIAANPALGVTLPRLPMSHERFLTAAELDALADVMPSERDAVLTLVLGRTGIRFGELTGLRVESIDTLRRRIRIAEAVAEVRSRIVVGAPKTHAARSVTLPEFLTVRLGEYLPRRTGLAFPDRDGGPLRVTNWNRRTFTPAADRIGLIPPALRVHDLRHTAASLMISSGAGVKVVQQQLGHTATMTLDRYAHQFPDELEALSSALDRLRSRTPADSLRTLGRVADLGGRRT